MQLAKVSSEETEPTPVDPGPEPPLGWADVLGEHVTNPPEARTEGRKLFEPDGTTHTVSPCEFRIKAQFELWVQNNALKAVAQVESMGDPERADRMMSAYTGDWGAGQYSWDGKHVRNARFSSLPGFRYLLYLLMVRCNKAITEEQVAELTLKYPRQCGELMKWALGNSQAPVNESNAGASNGTAEPKMRQRMTKNPPTLD